ncbi:MAG: SIS domain-containing protein [Deltaproteobacteria bacterium]|nr:SIS domain-containing protein [Deltaproteobacteria bacterium]
MTKFPDRSLFYKEIKEQPKALANTLAQYLAPNYQLKMTKPPLDDLTLKKIRTAYITACGTSYHAAMTARYIIEELARIPTVVEPASECGRHHLLVDDATLAVAISQSGRSKDTLAALKLAGSRGAATLALVNESSSPLTMAASGSLMTLAGKVQTLSSTKAFTSQTMVLSLMGLRLAQSRGLMRENWRDEVDNIGRLPELVRHTLSFEDRVTAVAERLSGYDHAFILASGPLLPMAFEGALKLKEVAKIHAEGYITGEFGHGPLALVGPGTPIILISFADDDGCRSLDLAAEFRARGAPLFLISEDGPNRDRTLADQAEFFLPLPQVTPRLRPVVAVIHLQLLAYHLGRLKGLDVDNTGGLIHSTMAAATANSAAVDSGLPAFYSTFDRFID